MCFFFWRECGLRLSSLKYLNMRTVSNPYFLYQPDQDEGIVGFSAWPALERNYTQHDLVLFENIDTNVGGHFQNSVFVCPVDGVYSFSIHITTQAGTSMSIRLMRNDDRLAGATCEAVAGVQVSAGNTVFAVCLAGDKVWVRSNENGAIRGNIRTNLFSGHLLDRY